MRRQEEETTGVHSNLGRGCRFCGRGGRQGSFMIVFVFNIVVGVHSFVLF